MINKEYFSNLSCYEELEIKSSLINEPISSVIKEIGKKCCEYYWIEINGEIIFFDNNGNKIYNSKDLKIKGNFNCSYTNITSLKGAPSEVGGSFWCDNTKITSLEGSPSEVGGNFCCYNTNITSLKGAPSEVGGSFWWLDNMKLTQKQIDDYKEFLKNPTEDLMDETGHYKPNKNCII